MAEVTSPTPTSLVNQEHHHQLTTTKTARNSILPLNRNNNNNDTHHRCRDKTILLGQSYPHKSHRLILRRANPTTNIIYDCWQASSIVVERGDIDFDHRLIDFELDHRDRAKHKRKKRKKKKRKLRRRRRPILNKFVQKLC